MESTLHSAAKTVSFQCLLILNLCLPANAQNWLWAKSYGQVPTYQARSSQRICVDGAGDVIIANMYYGQNILIDTYTLTNVGVQPNTTTDNFVVKHDASGNVLWAKNFGSSLSDIVNDVCVDASNNIYITGTLIGATSATTGVIFAGSQTNLTGQSGDMYLAKLDPNGNVLWIRGANGSDNETGRSVCTDASGNVFVAGMSASSTFDVSGTTFTNNAVTFGRDIFVAKYDPMGNLIWARQGGGPNHEYVHSIAADQAGNVVVVGQFDSPIMVLGPLTLNNTTPTTTTNPYANISDIFIAKYDGSGNVIWARSAGSTRLDYIHSVNIDANNDILVCGEYQGKTLSFGSIVLNNTDTLGYETDVFVAKYNAAGSLQWARTHGGIMDENAYGISTDASGNCYVIGEFQSTAMSFGNITLTNTVPPGFDIFIGKYDTNGNVLGATAVYGNGSEIANSVSCDGNGNVYILGYFSAFVSNTIHFGPVEQVSTTDNSVFLAKFSGSSMPTSIGSVSKDKSSFSLFPNPAQNSCRLASALNGTYNLKFYMGNGALVKELKLVSVQNGDSLIDTSDLPDGIYLLQLIAESQLYNTKLIIQH